MTEQPKFEEGMAELEGIVARLESPELSLEESIQLFEKGMVLSRSLGKRLDEAERKIELLIKDESGDTQRVPFDDSDAEPD